MRPSRFLPTLTFALVLAADIVALSRTPARASSATPACSIQAASEAATKAGLEIDAGLTQVPVNAVACGPFFGSGSQGMGAIIAVPTGCGYSVGWVVFRLEGDQWKLRFHEANGILQVQLVQRFDGGADIKTTQGYPRKNDPICFPSRMRSAVWHWNGQTFAPGPYTITEVKPATPGGAARHLYAFASPSRNILCLLGDEERAYSLTVTPPRSVSLRPNGRFSVCSGRRCVGSGKFGGVPTLRYGQQDSYAGYLCRSKQAGVTCVYESSGKGFLIGRSGVTRVGPR